MTQITQRFALFLMENDISVEETAYCGEYRIELGARELYISATGPGGGLIQFAGSIHDFLDPNSAASLDQFGRIMLQLLTSHQEYDEHAEMIELTRQFCGFGRAA